MRYFFMLCSIVFLLSCQQLKERDTIVEEVRLLSKENECELGFIDQTIDQSSELMIKLNCKPRSEFFPGDVVLDLFERLNKKGIERDRYTVKDSENKTLGVVLFKDAQNILKKRKKFEEDFQLLVHSEKDAFVNKIHYSIKTKIVDEIWFDRMFEMMKNNNTNWEFEGVLVQKQDADQYTTFGKKLGNEVIIWMSYKFKSKGDFTNDDKIYGVGVLPLK